MYYLFSSVIQYLQEIDIVKMQHKLGLHYYMGYAMKVDIFKTKTCTPKSEKIKQQWFLNLTTKQYFSPCGVLIYTGFENEQHSSNNHVLITTYRLTLLLITCYWETSFDVLPITTWTKPIFHPCVQSELYTNICYCQIQIAHTVPDYLNKTPDNKMSPTFCCIEKYYCWLIILHAQLFLLFSVC